MKKIEFGDDCLVSWDCLFMDTDFHAIRFESGTSNEDEAISIGEHVWFGCRSVALKGARVPEGCVVGAGGLVVGEIGEPNVLLAGVPVRVVRRCIAWKE